VQHCDNVFADFHQLETFMFSSGI